MDLDKVNDLFIVIGFIFAIISFGGLYLSSQVSNSCIIGSLAFSINNNSIDTHILGNKLKDCQSSPELNKDFTLMFFGIIGLTTPVIVSLVIAIIKKRRKKAKNHKSQINSENIESSINDTKRRHEKGEISKYVSLALVAITALATVVLAVGLFWSDRAIVTLSLGSFDNPPSFLLTDVGENYYANVLVSNAGKSTGDINLIITATNATVSFDKLTWGQKASTEMITIPNSATTGIFPILRRFLHYTVKRLDFFLIMSLFGSMTDTGKVCQFLQRTYQYIVFRFK
jgi:hypothetical protein